MAGLLSIDNEGRNEKHLKKNSLLKVIKIVLLCTLLISICISVFAHPGRTDSNGGHYNHKTGKYHYHSGEYAGRDSSSSIPWYMWYLIIIILVISIWAIYFVWTWISNSLPSTIVRNLDYALLDYKNATNHAEFCNKLLEEIRQKAVIPDGYEIGRDGLPKEFGIDNYEIDGILKNAFPSQIESVRINWGKSLTVYTVIDGWKLHLKEDCCGPFSIRKNIYSFYNKRYSICKKCASEYNPPNMEWYVEYLKLSNQIAKCEIAKSKENKALIELENCFNDCNTKMAKFLLFFSPSKRNRLDELKREYKQLTKG